MKYSRMGRYLLTPIFIFAFLASLPMQSYAQAGEQIKQRVDQLVHKHYVDGIQYAQANVLGKEAVPYLLELLANPAEKQFWVNIIVTLGFIEDSSAIDPLVLFLESAQGEVDGFTFRALLSVPFAIGCIAGNGDPEALALLKDMANAPPPSMVGWSFRQQKIRDLLAGEAVTGLAVSGRPEARSELLRIKGEIEKKTGPPGREFLLDNIRDGLKTTERIDNEGRAQIFNPQPDQR